MKNIISAALAALLLSGCVTYVKVENPPPVTVPEPEPLAYKFLYRSEDVLSSGTYWPLWGGYVTAHHVYKGAEYTDPPLVERPLGQAPGFIDVILYNTTLPEYSPRRPVVGEPVTIYGFPAGTETLEQRTGVVLRKRPPSEDYSYRPWTVILDDEQDAVYGGMSGGPVFDTENKPIGVLVGTPNLFDLDGDGDSDLGAIFHSLDDVWEVYNEPKSDLDSD